MFRRTRDRLVREITAAVLDAVGKQQPTGNDSGMQAVGTFFGETLKGMGAFMNGASELALKSSASLLGQKGGRAKARNRQLREMVKKATSECVLCLDPMHRGTTLAQIDFHRQHESRPQEPTPEPEPERGN